MPSGMRFRHLVMLFIVVVCLLSPIRSPGEETRLVMATEEWPPFRIDDPQSHSGFRGIDIELIESLAERIGVAIDIRRYPWARALEMMRSGQVDMITGAARTAEREVFMEYVPVSYCAVRPVFYTQKGRGQSVRSYQDLYGKKIGYSLRSSYFEPFDGDKKLDKVGLSTEQQLLKVLALRRLDLIIGTDPNISYDTVRLGLSNELEPTVFRPSEKTELFMALSRKSAKAIQLAPHIEQELRAMMVDGTVERILARYR